MNPLERVFGMPEYSGRKYYGVLLATRQEPIKRGGWSLKLQSSFCPPQE
jgi:hypothetical protein